MSEHLDSERPRDSEYWDALARRIGEDAAGPLATYAAAHDVWYGVLDRRAPWLVSACAAAMLVVWFGLPASTPSAAHQWIERSIAPNEGAGMLLGGAAPPSVHALLAQFPPSPQTPAERDPSARERPERSEIRGGARQ